MAFLQWVAPPLDYMSMGSSASCMFVRRGWLLNMYTVLWFSRRIQYGLRHPASLFMWWDTWWKHAPGVGLELLLSSLLDSELYSVYLLLVCSVVDVHTWYSCCRAIDSLHDVVRATSIILKCFLFVLFEGVWPAVVVDLAALVACDVFVNIRCPFDVALIFVLCKFQLIVAFYCPTLYWTKFGLPFQHQVVCRCHRCRVLVPSFWHIFFHLAFQ